MNHVIELIYQLILRKKKLMQVAFVADKFHNMLKPNCLMLSRSQEM